MTEAQVGAQSGVAPLERTRQSSFPARWRLIWSFSQRDLKARFTATALGLFWTLIVPISMVLIYSGVFTVVFRAQAPPMGNGHPGVFAPWFFVGLVSWNIFSTGVTTGMGSILALGAMMQKVYIPSFVPVAASTVTIVIERLIEAAVMLLLLLVFLNVSWTWLLYPFVFLLIAVLAGSLSYCLAVANVYLRDTNQIVGILMQLWFFLTPVMYPIDMVPEQWRGIPLRSLLHLNPMTNLVEMSRDLLYGLTLPGWRSVVYATVWVLVSAAAAVWVYRRWGRDVGEAI